MKRSLEVIISELLLKNGLSDVGDTSRGIADLLRRDPSALKDPSLLSPYVRSETALSGRSSRRRVAEIISAQLSPKLLEVEPAVESSAGDAFIFVATDLEFSSVAALLSGGTEGLDSLGHWRLQGKTRLGTVVNLIKTGQGNIASSSVVSSALGAHQPQLAVFAGVAGGLHSQEPGSVVIASYVHDYESAEDGLTRGSRAKSIIVGHALTQVSGAVARVALAGVPSIAVRPIASGEKLVTSSSSATSGWLNVVASDAAAIEMEGLGFMRAASNLGVPATVVRGVSDHKDDKSPVNDAKYQGLAATNAARVAIAIIEEFLKGV